MMRFLTVLVAAVAFIGASTFAFECDITLDKLEDEIAKIEDENLRKELESRLQNLDLCEGPIDPSRSCGNDFNFINQGFDLCIPPDNTPTKAPTTTTTTTQASTTTTTTQASTSTTTKKRYTCTPQCVDLVFVVHGCKQSVTAAHFQILLRACSNLVKKLSIGRGSKDSRASIVTFGATGSFQFALDKYKDQNSLITAIENVKQPDGSGANIDGGLTVAINQVLGTKRQCTQVIILITAGDDPNQTKCRQTITSARQKGIVVYGLGIQPGCSPVHLNTIVNDESRTTTVNDFSQIAEEVNTCIC